MIAVAMALFIQDYPFCYVALILHNYLLFATSDFQLKLKMLTFQLCLSGLFITAASIVQTM